MNINIVTGPACSGKTTLKEYYEDSTNIFVSPEAASICILRWQERGLFPPKEKSDWISFQMEIANIQSDILKKISMEKSKKHILDRSTEDCLAYLALFENVDFRPCWCKMTHDELSIKREDINVLFLQPVQLIDNGIRYGDEAMRRVSAWNLLDVYAKTGYRTYLEEHILSQEQRVILLDTILLCEKPSVVYKKSILKIDSIITFLLEISNKNISDQRIFEICFMLDMIHFIREGKPFIGDDYQRIGSQYFGAYTMGVKMYGNHNRDYLDDHVKEEICELYEFNTLYPQIGNYGLFLDWDKIVDIKEIYEMI